MNLVRGEGDREGGWERGCVGVQAGNRESPGTGSRGAEKGFIVIPEGERLVLMGRDFAPLKGEDRDVVPTKASGSRCMKKSRIFITVNGLAEFCPEFPIGDTLLNRDMQSFDGEGTKKGL